MTSSPGVQEDRWPERELAAPVAEFVVVQHLKTLSCFATLLLSSLFGEQIYRRSRSLHLAFGAHRLNFSWF